MEKELIGNDIDQKSASGEVYEVSYLLLPTIGVPDVLSKTANLKEMLASVGAELISDENPVLIDLAYSMTKIVGTTRHKVTSGYFGWIKFEISKEGILKVKKSLDSNDDVVRYLLIKTVRENTLLNGKMKLQKDLPAQAGDKSKGEEVDDLPEVKEVMPEEIDKSIDDLVIV